MQEGRRVLCEEMWGLVKDSKDVKDVKAMEPHGRHGYFARLEVIAELALRQVQVV